VPRMSAVFAVDLNGVIVDSQDECTRSAWIAACELWPDAMAFAGDDAVSANPWRAGARRAWADGEWETLKGVGADGIPNWLDAKLRLLRPIFEDGSDAVLLMRLCADEAAAAMKTTSGARPLSVGEIVTNWGDELRETLLARYGLPREALAEQYAQVRDEWLAADADGWLAAHSFHSEAVAALRECSARDASVYVLTTKPQRFAIVLLEHIGVALEPSHVFGLEHGPKSEVLYLLLERHPTEQLCVVDDNAVNLRGMAADRRLFSAQLWFAAWGYSTPQQRALVATMPRVRTLDNGAALHRVLVDSLGAGH